MSAPKDVGAAFVAARTTSCTRTTRTTHITCTACDGYLFSFVYFLIKGYSWQGTRTETRAPTRGAPTVANRRRTPCQRGGHHD